MANQLGRIRRFLRFLWEAERGLWNYRKLPRNASRMQRARWLHESCSSCLHALGIDLQIAGELPNRGLIVSNHLSYLDVGVLSAAIPCVFVSKAEVEHWPIFGPYARSAGSVFVRRHDRADAARANVSVADALCEEVPVVLFPEGTTTDGSHVLRFHSTMLQPAIDTGAQITPCTILYELNDGDVRTEVCWWGDMKLLPHLWNLLGKKGVCVRVQFGAPQMASGDRKQLSVLLREKVVRLQKHRSEALSQL